MNKTEKLLPCPFCGQQPTEYAIEPHTHALQFSGGKMPDHQGSHVIECACGCGIIDATREEVFSVWNRRPTPCLHQIQEPAPVQAAQTEGSVSNATLEVAPAAVAEQALLKVLHAIQRYMPPDGVSDRETLSEIIGIVDPWPLGDVPAAVAVPDDIRAALSAAVEQIEHDALKIEMEWGTGRNLYGMEIDGELPPALLQARAALAATPAADAPAGWKLVPMEPTAEMLESAGETDRDGTPASYKTLYMAMVGAAPAAAPVVLPEPAGCLVTVEGESHHLDANLECAELWVAEEQKNGAPYVFGYENLYTEQQVRALLATVTGKSGSNDSPPAGRSICTARRAASPVCASPATQDTASACRADAVSPVHQTNQPHTYSHRSLFVGSAPKGFPHD